MVCHIKSGLLEDIRHLAGNSRDYMEKIDDERSCNYDFKHNYVELRHSNFSFSLSDMGRRNVHD